MAFYSACWKNVIGQRVNKETNENLIGNSTKAAKRTGRCKETFYSLDGNLERVKHRNSSDDRTEISAALEKCRICDSNSRLNESDDPCPSPPLVTSSLEDLSHVDTDSKSRDSKDGCGKSLRDDFSGPEPSVETDADDEGRQYAGPSGNPPYGPQWHHTNVTPHSHEQHCAEPQPDIHVNKPSKYNAQEAIQVRWRPVPRAHSFPISHAHGHAHYIIPPQGGERYMQGTYYAPQNGAIAVSLPPIYQEGELGYSLSASSLTSQESADRLYEPPAGHQYYVDDNGYRLPYPLPAGPDHGMNMPRTDPYYYNTAQHVYPPFHPGSEQYDSSAVDSPDRLYVHPSGQTSEYDAPLQSGPRTNPVIHPSYHRPPSEHYPAMASENDDMYYMHPAMAKEYYCLPEHVTTRSLPPDFENPYFASYYPEILYHGRYDGAMTPPSSPVDGEEYLGICSVPGCGNHVVNKGTDGMCLGHYRRQLYEEVRLAHQGQVMPNVTCDLPREGECRWVLPVIILRPRQNGHHFADDIFKCI